MEPFNPPGSAPAGILPTVHTYVLAISCSKLILSSKG